MNKTKTAYLKARELRLAAGLTIDELAKMAGIARQTIYNIEAGRSWPKQRVTSALLTVFNCTPNDLIGVLAEE